MAGEQQSDARSVLVYRIGSLGDTLVSVPALWAVRDRFPQARIAMLCDSQRGRNHVSPADLLRGGGMVDEFIAYPVDMSPSGRLLRPMRMLTLAMKLRSRRFDALVYLAPTGRLAAQVERDRKFFALAGITRTYGLTASDLPPRRAPLPVLPPEADLLMSRLSASGLTMPAPASGRLDLGLTKEDERPVRTWLAGLPPDGDRPWVAVAPGSKMPAKLWPLDRYQQVVAGLIERFDVWPVIFGGREDQAAGEQLIAAWGRGYMAAGALGVRPSASAIARCKLYLGNDTGTMHMAASAGVRCVAVFSSRDFPGLWHPYGPGHATFRTPIDCEGCMLEACVERKMECILGVTENQVLDACVAVLDTSAVGAER